jgi:ubiquitin carboxyl-terminal hydrolase 14
MNATLQCLKRVNELKEHLTTGVIKKDEPNGVVAAAMGELFKFMDTGVHHLPITSIFVSTFKNFNPEFAEKDESGYPMQQDSDEFLMRVLQHLQPICSTIGLDGERENLVDRLFKVTYESSFRNQELEGESRVHEESAYKQICIIDNQGHPINSLEDGIKASMDATIEMRSDLAGRNCLFLKEQRIKKLPSYLLVQMIRFFWKEADEASGTKATRSKILRSVAFPRFLDMYPHCTQKLKDQLEVGRQYEKKQREEE